MAYIVDVVVWQAVASVLQSLSVLALTAFWILLTKGVSNYGLNQILYLDIVSILKLVKETVKKRHKVMLAMYLLMLLLTGLSDILAFNLSSQVRIASEATSTYRTDWQPRTITGFFQTRNEVIEAVDSLRISSLCVEDSPCFETEAVERTSGREVGEVIRPRKIAQKALYHNVTYGFGVSLGVNSIDISFTNNENYTTDDTGTVYDFEGSPDFFRDAQGTDPQIEGQRSGSIAYLAQLGELTGDRINRWSHPDRQMHSDFTVCRGTGVCVDIFESSFIKNLEYENSTVDGSALMNEWGNRNGITRPLMNFSMTNLPSPPAGLTRLVTTFGQVGDMSYSSNCVGRRRTDVHTLVSCQVLTLRVYRSTRKLTGDCTHIACTFMNGKLVTKGLVERKGGAFVNVHVNTIAHVMKPENNGLPGYFSDITEDLTAHQITSDYPEVKYKALHSKRQIELLGLITVGVWAAAAVGLWATSAIMADKHFKLPALYSIISTNSIENGIKGVGDCKNIQLWDHSRLQLGINKLGNHIAVVFDGLEVSLTDSEQYSKVGLLTDTARCAGKKISQAWRKAPGPAALRLSTTSPEAE